MTGAAPDRPISLAILAMGGQGGGVLADWIVATAEAAGWHAQSTSVPGVAQRTGATLYYIEMLPARGGKAPVFALMPTPGDVDVVMAAELMEAGRSILRGLVTPERTILITSTHRAYAVSEKEKPGNGTGDPQAVTAAAGFSARRVVAFDMDAIARSCATVISAPLLGALAGSGALPFARSDFERVISDGGRGAGKSLTAFAEGFARAGANELAAARRSPPKAFAPLPAATGHPQLDALLLRIAAFPVPLRPMLFAGTRRTVDFQDPDYGAEYLSRLEDLLARDRSAGGETRAWRFTETAAKYLAVAMAYDDVIGVADRKTRASRLVRIRAEVGATETPLHITEFLHPRAEELIGLLPHRLGTTVSARPRLVRLIDAMFNRGRRIGTTTIRGFLQLYVLAALKPRRRRLHRHAIEMTHMEAWLATALSCLDRNYDLAVAALSARRLVKGYSETHARGTSKFDRVLSAVPRLSARPDGGAWLERMITAALMDEQGAALDGVLKTTETL